MRFLLHPIRCNRASSVCILPLLLRTVASRTLLLQKNLLIVAAIFPPWSFCILPAFTIGGRRARRIHSTASSTTSSCIRSSTSAMPLSWSSSRITSGPNDGSNCSTASACAISTTIITTSCTSTTTTTLPLFRNKYTTYLQWRQQQRNYYSSDETDQDDNDSFFGNDADKRIHLPNLKYGYRTVPLEWDEIVYAVEHDLALLSRSVTQQRDYEMYKRDLLMREQWQTVLDHVLCTKFPHIFRPVLVEVAEVTAAAVEEEPQNHRGGGRRSDLRQWRAHPTLEEAAAAAAASNQSPEGATATTTLVRNDFPYYMADGLEHWVLWKLGGPCSDEDVARAKRELAAQHQMDPDNMIHWVNPPNLQSLPAIDHVHIIGRRRIQV